MVTIQEVITHKKTNDIISCKGDDNIVDVLSVLVEHKIHALPLSVNGNFVKFIGKHFS